MQVSIHGPHSFASCVEGARGSDRQEGNPQNGIATFRAAGLDCRLVLFCAQGFSSSLAAASLRDLGCGRATDLVGGFEAWKAAGLPVRAFSDADEPAPRELPGMGPPAR